MSASQVQAGATGAVAGLALLAARQDETVMGKSAAARRTWPRRQCLSSFMVGGVTILIVWVAVTALLWQGRLETVLSAGRAELAVGRTGLYGRPVPVERDDSAPSALLLLAGQLAEPLQRQR